MSLCSYRESSPADLGRFREEIAREGKLENIVRASFC
jgi:hypothetical protein